VSFALWLYILNLINYCSVELICGFCSIFLVLYLLLLGILILITTHIFQWLLHEQTDRFYLPLARGQSFSFEPVIMLFNLCEHFCTCKIRQSKREPERLAISNLSCRSSSAVAHSNHRYLMRRLSLQVFYLWRHMWSTALPFILWWSNLEILFASSTAALPL
jgi:hypothetical protein